MPNRRAVLAALPAVALPVVLSPGALSAHPPETLAREWHGAAEQQVMAARDSIRTAAAARDAAKLRTLYAADFTHTHTTGKTDGRDARIVALLTGEPTIELARVQELTIRVLHPDTAILAGRSALPENGGAVRDVRWMQVFVRVDGDWKVAASQGTPVAPTI